MATWSKAANLHTVFGHSWYLIYLDILDCFGVLLRHAAACCGILRHAAACCNSVLAVISLVPTVFILTRFFLFFYYRQREPTTNTFLKDVLSAALLLWPRMLLMKPGSQVLEWRLRLQESIAVGCTGCADDYGCNLKSQREKMKTSKTVRECSTSLRLLVLTVYGCHMACQCLPYCQASRWTWQTIMTESCITCHPVTKTTLFLTCTVLLTICFHLRDSSPSCFPGVVLVQILAAEIYI